MLPAFPMFAPYATTFSPLQEKSPRGDCWRELRALFGSVLGLLYSGHVFFVFGLKHTWRGQQKVRAAAEPLVRHIHGTRRKPESVTRPARTSLRAAIRIFFLHNFASTPSRRRRRRAWFTRTETYALAGGGWAKLAFLIPSLLTSLLRGGSNSIISTMSPLRGKPPTFSWGVAPEAVARRRTVALWEFESISGALLP